MLGQRSPATPHLKRTATPCANAVQHLSRMEYVDRVLTFDRVDSLSVSKSSLVCWLQKLYKAVRSFRLEDNGPNVMMATHLPRPAEVPRCFKHFQTISQNFTFVIICVYISVAVGKTCLLGCGCRCLRSTELGYLRIAFYSMIDR